MEAHITDERKQDGGIPTIDTLEQKHEELVIAAAEEIGTTPDDVRQHFADEREIAVAGIYNGIDHMGG